jgi:hypothetical protein
VAGVQQHRHLVNRASAQQANNHQLQAILKRAGCSSFDHSRCIYSTVHFMLDISTSFHEEKWISVQYCSYFGEIFQYFEQCSVEIGQGEAHGESPTQASCKRVLSRNVLCVGGKA